MTLHTATDTYWQGTIPEPPAFPPLDQDLWVDAVVIGAGITGLTAALLLKQAGRKVAVLEGGRVGSGTTGGTSAHLTAVTDTPLHTLADRFGRDGAALAVEAQEMAIDRVRRWVEGFGIECEFREQVGYRFCEGERGVAELERDCDAALRLGLPATMTREVPLPFPCAAAMRVEDQARFHPLRYLHALAGIVRGGGCEIYEHTRAAPPEDGEPCRVHAAGGAVTAEAVIVAAHGPFLGAATLATRAFPYTSYVIAVRVDSRRQPIDGLFWDTAMPYHYLRRASDDEPDLLLIGGADHKTGQGGDERERFDRLEAYARRRFAVRGVEQRWSAELYEPADGLPYIGAVPRMRNVFQACGYSGTGMTFGTAAGILMADLALGRENPWAGLFDPSRLKLGASLPRVVSENLNVASKFLAGRITPGAGMGAEAPHVHAGLPEEAGGAGRTAGRRAPAAVAEATEPVDAVAPGQGRVLRLGGETQPTAVYRAEDGRVHAMSPVCTHMGCVVTWNEAERTWDCPCHGGRYKPTGEVLEGPPPRGLAKRRGAAQARRAGLSRRPRPGEGSRR